VQCYVFISHVLGHHDHVPSNEPLFWALRHLKQRSLPKQTQLMTFPLSRWQRGMPSETYPCLAKNSPSPSLFPATREDFFPRHESTLQNSTVPHTPLCRRCWRILLVTIGRAGVHWPIYRMILLAPVVLTQPILIIIGAECIKTTDTKNILIFSVGHVRTTDTKDRPSI
jgi:hypothetical protein